MKAITDLLKLLNFLQWVGVLYKNKHNFDQPKNFSLFSFKKALLPANLPEIVTVASLGRISKIRMLAWN